VTPQRQLILDSIRAAGGHVTPNEIFRRVSAQMPAVNRATVYRNLDFLCEMRMVVAAQIWGQMYYEIAGEVPHHHLVCRNCDRIEMVNHQAVKGFFAKIQRDQRFAVDMDHLTLFGLCRKCQRARKRAGK
jgi:Fur family ferric uptake transcriptional regulator